MAQHTLNNFIGVPFQNFGVQWSIYYNKPDFISPNLSIAMLIPISFSIALRSHERYKPQLPRKRTRISTV